MTGEEIIAKFEVYVDDGTELSSSEELDLLNKIYNAVCNFRPWEFLKTSASGTMTNYEIDLPTDFGSIANSSSDSDYGPSIFVGSELNAYPLVNFGSRRQYQNQDVAYIDPSDSKIKFMTTPSSTTYEFDYIKVPEAITLATSPIFPARFHDVIYHGMASDDYIIQQFDKARSYSEENKGRYTDILKDMSLWNAQFNF